MKLAVGLVLSALLAVACGHLPPLVPDCNPATDSVRDREHRVMWNADCYVCTNAAPGRLDEGNHYRCLDYTCNECDKPVVNFGEKHRPDGGAP